MEKLDPYAELGVRRDATPAQIKAAYRELVKTVHPDAGGGREEFDRLTRAYDVLKDPKMRAAFDATGEIGARDLDPMEVRVIEEIARVMRMVLAGEEDPLGADLVLSIQKFFEQEAVQIASAVPKMERAIRRTQKLEKKFKRKRGGNNVFPAMLIYERGELEKGLAQAKSDLAVRRAAIKYLDDYEFEPDLFLPPSFMAASEPAFRGFL